VANTVRFSIDIPVDKKEIITAFKGLIDAFKGDIKVKEVESGEVFQENKNFSRLEEFKKQFGHLKYEAMPTKEDLAEIRTRRYAQ
jgi:hypothetical protein